jgi:protein CpxP
MINKTLIALATVGVLGGVASSAFAQSNQMPSGPTNAPPGTARSGTAIPDLPPSTTGTASPGALNSTSTTGAEAAAKTKIEAAGYSNVKGLTRSPDGTWSGRAVKDGVEIAVSMDADGRIAQQ